MQEDVAPRHARRIARSHIAEVRSESGDLAAQRCGRRAVPVLTASRSSWSETTAPNPARSAAASWASFGVQGDDPSSVVQALVVVDERRRWCSVPRAARGQRAGREGRGRRPACAPSPRGTRSASAGRRRPDEVQDGHARHRRAARVLRAPRASGSRRPQPSSLVRGLLGRQLEPEPEPRLGDEVAGFVMVRARAPCGSAS